MDLTTLLRICRQYNDLGWAVQEQLGRLVSEHSTHDLNPNAVRIIEHFFKDVASVTSSDSGALVDDIESLLEGIE